MYYYRNKLAHNGTFTGEEIDDCTKLCSEITDIIDTAYKKLDTFKPSTSDQEALMAAVNEFAYGTLQSDSEGGPMYTTITRDILLEELKNAQNKLPFVGLRHFVVDWLGNKGFDYDASFALINYLEDKKVIRLEKVDNPKGDHRTTKISLLESCSGQEDAEAREHKGNSSFVSSQTN